MTSIRPIGTIYENEMPTVVVHTGMRGSRGIPGEEGDPGPQGNSINLRGEWVSGSTYAPLDGVTWRSSTLGGVDSLYLQISAWPEAVSTVPPNEDAARWMEVGLSSDEGLLGGVWLVTQTSHGFTRVGTPVHYSAGSYTLASAASTTTYGVALVREIVDENQFILQSTGGIPAADPGVSSEGSFVDGRLYYLSPTAGFLSEDRPGGANQLVQPLYQHGTVEGIVLPWTPVANETILIPVNSARDKFFYTAADGQQVFTGADENGNTPDFTGAAVEVFQNGLNLREDDQYTHDLTSVTLVVPALEDDKLEIWSEVPSSVTVYARLKADALVFDGVAATFDLNVAGSTVAVTTQAVDLDVYLDGNPQEPDVDYTVADNGGQAEITFASAPEAETGSWIVLITE